MGSAAATGVSTGVAAAASQYPVMRRFVDVGGRRVHGRVMGNGPPILFVHSSPANSAFVIPEMEPLAARFTCYAFDTPGFGLSDPLAGEELTVADLADALADTLAAIGMPPCPVFGCHTGAAIALELAVRHPRLVTGLMLDSLSCFTSDELAGLEGYFAHFPLDPLGGHYSSIWTRFRDQSIWFPWFARDPEALNESDLTSPQATDRWVKMFYDARETYAPAYRAAMNHQGGPEGVRRLTVPMVLTSIESDMLYPHLQRVQPVRPDQRILQVGNSVTARRALTARTLAEFDSRGAAPVLPAELGSSKDILRQFVDLAHGQLLVRSVGDRSSSPLLVIHDVPGAGGTVEEAMAVLAERHFVVAFDLPGCGESVALDSPAIGDLAATLWQGCDVLGLGRLAILGIGFGSALAIEMAAMAPDRAASLALDGMLLADDDERDALRRGYCPPVSIEPDGSHWFRTWQMIRDMGIWWPWFTPTRAALRRVPAEFGAEALHWRTCESLRQPGAWAGVVAAALDADSAARLEALRISVTFVEGSANPVATAYATRARELFPQAKWRALGDI